MLQILKVILFKKIYLINFNYITVILYIFIIFRKYYSIKCDDLPIFDIDDYFKCVVNLILTFYKRKPTIERLF